MLQLLPALMSAVTNDIEKVVRRKRRNFIGYCIAVLFGLTAYAAGVMALVMWLLQSSSPMMAWLVVGVISISLSLLVIVTLAGIYYFEKHEHRQNTGSASTTTFIASSQIANSKTLLPILLSLLGAYLAQPKPRKTTDGQS